MKVINEYIGNHFKSRAIMGLYECPVCSKEFVAARGDVRKMKSCGCIQYKRTEKHFMNNRGFGRVLDKNHPAVAYRASLNLSVEEFSKKIKVSVFTIYRLEHNKYKSYNALLKTFKGKLPVEVLDKVKKLYTQKTDISDLRLDGLVQFMLPVGKGR